MPRVEDGPVQELLDAEAELGNWCYDNKDKVQQVIIKRAEIESIHSKIRELRGIIEPCCFGEDDCSTEFLMHCPWRIDCGT